MLFLGIVVLSLSPLLAVFTNAAPITSDQGCTNIYTDVPPDFTLCYYINFLTFRKVISGYPDFTYRPQNLISRGELSKILVNTFELHADTSDTPDFADVPETDTFYTYVKILRELKIINGFKDNTFRSSEPVTKSMLTKIIINIMNLKNPNLFGRQEELNTFTDVPANHPYYDYIRRMYVETQNFSQYQQIIPYVTHDTKFYPDAKINRGTVAKTVTNGLIYTLNGTQDKIIHYTKLITGIQPTRIVHDDPYIMYNFGHLGITVLATSNGFTYRYNKVNAPSLEQMGIEAGYRYVVNGGYYGGTSYESEHAGLLNIYGTKHTSITFNDPQLTHIIRYSKNDSSFEIIDIHDYTERADTETLTEIQTGPLVIQDNHIAYNYILESNNGAGRHLRTLLATTDGKKKFFILVKDNYSLTQLSTILLNMGILKSPTLRVINLDGGHSTSMYSKDHPEFNFGSGKHIPNLFGFE